MEESAMKGIKDTRIPDADSAWGRLHDRLEREHLIPSAVPAERVRPLVYALRIAAALLLLIGIGSAVYLITGRKQATEMVRVNTGESQNTLIKTLADGSVIYLAGNSSFSFPGKFSTGSRNVELQGEAFFDVAPDPGKPFVIETGPAVIRVVGTAFNVKTGKEGGFELFVDRGKVEVTLKSDPSVTALVAAGEKISAVRDGLVKTKHIPDEAGSWYRQRMEFKDEPLSNILRVLNQNFNTTFALADPQTGAHKLTVTFQNETAETMAELICVTLNLKSQTIDGAVVFSENRGGKREN
jgi:ferric-dicitrate binding protein FerR (iron transport regulator)